MQRIFQIFTPFVAMMTIIYASGCEMEEEKVEVIASALGVAVAGSYAYVTTGGAGLRVVDISNPRTPKEVGVYETGHGWFSDVAVSDGYAYVAGGKNIGLRVVDVSNPTDPKEVGIYETKYGYVFEVAVSGSYAYVGGRHIGLRVVDVSNPTDPKEVGRCDETSYYVNDDVAVSESYAYVAKSSGVHRSGLYVVDVSNPTDPKEVGVCEIETSSYRFKNVVVSGSYAYVGGQRTGLHVVDVSNPTDPKEVGVYEPEYDYDYCKVAVSGSYAYVGDKNIGLCVIDVSNPTDPKEVGRCGILPVSVVKFSEGIEDIAVSGSYVYVATFGYDVLNSIPVGTGSGLHAVDISNPTTPKKVGFYETPTIWEERREYY